MITRPGWLSVSTLMLIASPAVGSMAVTPFLSVVGEPVQTRL
jgi:hypothetical protein